MPDDAAGLLDDAGAEALRALAAAATPGPWDVDVEPPRSCAAAVRHKWNGGQKTVAYVEGPGLSGLDHRRRAVGLANAAFIAAARSGVPALLARLDAAEAARDAAEARAGALEKALRGLVAWAVRERGECMECYMGYTGEGGCTHEPEELRAARRALGGEAP